MTILIIIAIIIAIAYIFGKRYAQIIIFGSGVLSVGIVVLGLLGLLIAYLWDQNVINLITSTFFILLTILLVIVWIIKFLSKDKETQKSKLDYFIEQHPFLYLFMIFSVICLIIGMVYLISTETNIENDDASETIEIQNSYKYYLNNVTNVRSCASLNCDIVGQYPANTEFEFSTPISDFQEWIMISWVGDTGKSQSGYVHKSTFKQTYFDRFRSLNN